MWVVKLGGSLHGSDGLAGWLRAAAAPPGPPRVIVPGGGAFADAVRRWQAERHLDEVTAHRMAILAMQQAGLYLHALAPRLALAETDADLAAARAAVWLPWRLAGREPTLRASWDVTSDTIACWLAERLGAAALVIVKSAALPAGRASVAALAGSGILDAGFPAMAASFPGRIVLLPGDPAPAALDEALLASGCRVTDRAQPALSSAAGSSASTTARAAR